MRSINELVVDWANLHLDEVRRLVEKLPDGAAKRDLQSAAMRASKAIEELQIEHRTEAC